MVDLRCDDIFLLFQKDQMKGIYYILDKTKSPDIIVYYCHGKRY